MRASRRVRRREGAIFETLARRLTRVARLSTITPMMSDSFMIRSSSPSSFTSVPDHLPNSTRSPAFDVDRDQLAGFVAAAGTDGDDFALLTAFPWRCRG